MKKKLMVLGGSEFQKPLLKRASEMGCQTMLLDINRNASAIGLADHYRHCSITDIGAAMSVAEEFRPDGITAGMCDSGVLAASLIAETLGLPGLPPEAARAATDKGVMIRAFEASGVPHPEYLCVTKGHLDIEGINIPCPLIVKPLNMAGSRGVRLVEDVSLLRDAIEESSLIGGGGGVLVEEYMSGREVSVELVVTGGKATVMQVTDKMTSGAPYFMETGHAQPSSLDDDTLRRVGEVAVAAAHAVGIDNSLVHAEVMVTGSGPRMVELGARMGGDSIQEQLIMLSAGIDVPEMSIRFALGERVDPPSAPFRHGSAIMFVPSRQGTISAVRGVDAARSIPGVRSVEIYGKVGDPCGSPTDNSGRIGHVISEADTRDEAVAACRAAIEAISVDFE